MKSELLTAPAVLQLKGEEESAPTEMSEAFSSLA